MLQVTAEQEFRPLNVGVSETWGFIVKGASGESTLQIRVNGQWEDVASFDESATFVDKLRRDARYRFSTISADAIFVI